MILAQQQTAVGRSIISGQFRKFLVEALETKAESQGLGVLNKQFTRLRDSCRRIVINDGEFRDGARYPMSMPPLTLSTWPVM